MDITVEYLKTQIKEYNFETLTGGDEGVAEQCIRKAELWVKAILRKAGVEPDYSDEIDREALTKRTLYELYSFAENEDVAKDKARDAVDLLRAKYGNAITAAGNRESGQKPVGDPVGAVKPGSNDWQGFK